MRGEDGVRVLGNHRVLLLVLVLAASTWTVTGSSAPTPGLAVETRSVGLTNPLALQPHDPIHITGNEGFNASNGVQSGSGTVRDHTSSPNGSLSLPSTPLPTEIT